LSSRPITDADRDGDRKLVIGDVRRGRP